MKIAVLINRKAVDAAWDQQDHKVYQGLPDLLDQPEQLALKDRWDYKDLLDQLVQLAPKDLRARLVRPARPDLVVLLEQLARLARPAP